MVKKMTVVFHDEELYTDLKIEAVKRNRSASGIIAEAVQEWLDVKEDEALIPVIDARLTEYEEKGGQPWDEVRKELEEARARRKEIPVVAERKNV